MVSDFPIITFDTSAHNRLVKGGAASEAVLAAINSGLFFRFAGLSVEELLATPEPAMRMRLLACCARLQAGANDCLYPQNELIRILVVAHNRSPSDFDWKTVDVRAQEYEEAIRRYGEFVSDQQLVAAQGVDLKRRKVAYKGTFSDARPSIRQVFKKYNESPPAKLREVISRLQSADSALIRTMAKGIYDRGAGADANELSVKQFMERCPPFRSLIYALLMSWYNFSIRDPSIGEKCAAGGTDQFMSIYLAYCDKFVTADAEQERCLREICALTGLETEVLSYDDFCESLLAAT